MITAAADGAVWMWDVETGEERSTFQNFAPCDPKTRFEYCGTVKSSADGRTLAGGRHDGTVKLWDVAKRQEIDTLLFLPDGPVKSLSFSPDGKTLFAMGRPESVMAKPRIKRWDVEEIRGHFDSQGLRNVVFALTFSPDGKTSVSGSWDGTVRVWDVAKGQVSHQFQNSNRILPLALSSDGEKLAAAGGDHILRVWEVPDGRLVRLFRGSANFSAVAFSPDGKAVADANDDGFVALWDNPEDSFSQPRPLFLDVSYRIWWIGAWGTDKARKVARGGEDGTIKLLDVTQGPERLSEPMELHGHEDVVLSGSFSPARQLMASGDWDGTVRIWDVSSGKAVPILRGHGEPVFCVAFSPDGKTLASGSFDSTVKLWDVTPGRGRATLSGHIGSVSSLAYSPDGDTLASGGSDATVRQWNVVDGKPLKAFHSESPKSSEGR